MRKIPGFTGLKQLWAATVRVVRRAPQPPDWLVYVLEGHAPSQFYYELFRRAASPATVMLVRDLGDFKRYQDTPNTPFVYFGHGTGVGSYSSVGFGEGLRNLLCDANQSQGFFGSPHIWWASFSAQWLRRGTRADWLGYAGLVGADPRGDQSEWWSEQLVRLMGNVLDVAKSHSAPDDVRAAANRLQDDARRQYYNGKRLSWTSVLCARLIADGIDWHSKFGETKP